MKQIKMSTVGTYTPFKQTGKSLVRKFTLVRLTAKSIDLVERCTPLRGTRKFRVTKYTLLSLTAKSIRLVGKALL